MRIGFWTITAAVLATTALPANASLRISSKPTNNVTCTAGTCAATAKSANLNTADLQTMLAAGDVSVASTTKAKDIEVRGALAWSSTHGLTLDASHGIAIDGQIAIQGTSALTLTTNDGETGGTIAFGPKSSIDFLDTNSALTIDGQAYGLVSDIATLSAAVQHSAIGHYALARDYDAGPDGVYPQDPVTAFPGTFEGLGHTIKNLKVTNSFAGVHVGMFYQIGTVSHFHLVNAHIKSTGTNVSVGLLAGGCGTVTGVNVSGSVTAAPGSLAGGICGVVDGNITDSSSSGAVVGKGNSKSAFTALGGLAGLLDGGTISNAHSSDKVNGAKGWTAGGLVGQTGTGVCHITNSFATGVVIVADNGVSGGLVGNNAASEAIDNSYATGFTGGGVGSRVGGFIGINDGPVSDSYSSGAVASGSGNAVGGFIGVDQGPNDLTDTYFDTDTSGQSHGVGNNTAYPGVTGLTTAQFQAGLPAGFDPSIWAENSDVNGGLPYLLGSPPG